MTTLPSLQRSGAVMTGWTRRFAGLWAAITLPTHRRRGIYSALVVARALEAARRGFDFVMVDALADSSLILKRMGFLCVTASHACVWTQRVAR